MRKIFFTLTLITIPILSIFASGEKETNLGGQIDVYAEYSPIEEVTLSLGEEISFANFLAPENGLFDARQRTKRPLVRRNLLQSRARLVY